jgi:opacity protein-like surface antigen
MTMRKKRLLLLSSSAIMLLSFAGVAAPQVTTTPGTAQPETTTTPAETVPATPPEGAKPAEPPAGSSEPPQQGTALPPVTVTPPPEKKRQQPAVEQATREPPPARETPAREVERTVPPRVPAEQGTQIPAQTATFNERRESILAPVGTAPTTMSREAIEALPQGTNANLDKVLLQFPGVTQDSAASGQLHVRNEHANVSYRINGILLPDGLGGFGQFIDTSFIGSLTLITGALPAQYGLRTAGIVDIQTASGAFNNAGQVGWYGGSRQTQSSNIQYGGRTGSTEYFFTGRYLQNILGIENTMPTLNAIHDRTMQDRSFAYVSTIIDPWTRVSFIGGIANNKFQIPDRQSLPPSFTAFGNSIFDSAKLDENQVEHYKFAVVALQKSVNDVDFQFAYFNRMSTVHFTPDPLGDLMFNGVASDVFRGSVVNGIQVDSAFRLNPAHTLRMGLYGSAEKTTVANSYQLLPFDNTTGGQLAGVPDVPFPANDTSVLLGWLGSAYVSDEWKITDRLTLNSGLRFDQMWQYQTANQLNPRLSVTYRPFDTTTFHAGYARFFTPPVQVIAAPSNTNLFTSCLNIPTCTTILAPSVPPPYHPMLPERASVYDIGVTQKVLPGLEVGADVYLKQSRDLIDDGQFGAALVLNGFNYEQAQNVGVELKALYTNGNFRAYANWAWANQKARNIITNQYLFDPGHIAYAESNWVYTDHSQVYSASGGVSYLWNGTRFSADLIYGSGLRAGFSSVDVPFGVNTDHNPSYAQVNTGLSREIAIPGWAPVVARFDVVNVFDTSYVIRNGSGIGVFAPQYGPRRGYYFGLAQKFGPGANDGKPVGATYSSGYGGRLASRAARGMDGMVYTTPRDAIWTWTGLYIGANAGKAWGRFSTDTVFTDATLGVPVGPVLASSNSSSKLQRGFVGGTAGYNWQWGAWLAGLETDVQFSHQRAPTSAACAPAICAPDAIGVDTPVTTNVSHNLDWFGTVRGRVGALITPDAIVYATGGLAFGEIEHIGVISPISIGNDYFVSRSMRGGWVLGGGIEARLAGNLTGKVEYLHMDFGRYSALATNIGNADPVNVSFNSHISEDLVRLGLNYKLGPVAVYATAYPSDGGFKATKLGRPRFVTKAAPGDPWTWTGYYLGLNAGFSWGNTKTDTLFSDETMGGLLYATSSSSRLGGKLGGAQTGYNWQLGPWVWGIEADAQLADQRGTPITRCPDLLCNLVGTGPVIAQFDQYQKIEWFATLRGRFGAALTPSVLLYVTAGGAVGEIQSSGNVYGSFDQTGSIFTNPFSAVTLNRGWTSGGGVEARLCGSLTGRIEYLFLDLGYTHAIVNNQQIMTLTAQFSSRITDQIVRAGLSYKFH